jgi:hypothetical protein
MKARIRRFFTPAVLAATIPATAVLAQAPQQTQTAPSAQPTRPSADTLARLQLAQKAPSKQGNEDIRNVKLADAASINEDLIGFALEGKVDKVAEKVAAMRKAHSTSRALLDDTTFETLGRQITDMEQASSKNDALGTALVAVEVYRNLENAMDAAQRPSPIEVAMMDYSGFKLSILAGGQAPDWGAIAVTARESDGSWSALVKQVPDTSIRNLVGTIQAGLRAAVERKDIHGVRFAAKMQLEVVDVLEQSFNRPLKKVFGPWPTPRSFSAAC